ncbi:hypothetical protein [uncultured Methylobacterium sp.]|jgi:hypothetical protein|uniref:hypothetical protein n=1 Tax=uncultured Methylobacterium sp. TaxID=157278 RepID=UPI0026030094|nr:hypothetical protein [uncultured Methylobacterium sp.]
MGRTKSIFAYKTAMVLLAAIICTVLFEVKPFWITLKQDSKPEEHATALNHDTSTKIEDKSIPNRNSMTVASSDDVDGEELKILKKLLARGSASIERDIEENKSTESVRSDPSIQPSFVPQSIISRPSADKYAPSDFKSKAEMQIFALGSTVRSLPIGKILLAAPDKMKIGDQSKVDASVTTEKSSFNPSEYDQKGRKVIEGKLRISPEMVASLSGPGFKINPITPERQNIGDGLVTVWSWNIEANSDGEQVLEATLYALVPASDKETRQRIDSYRHNIQVSVRPLTWIEWFESLENQIKSANGLIVAISTLMAAVLGWFGISLRKKKESDTEPKAR